MRCVVLPVLLLAALAAGADVGVDTILAPVGTVDSGQMGTPRCVVVNYADSASNVKVMFAILDAGGPVYRDSLLISGLPAGARDTAAFVSWVPEARDSLVAKAWTTCAGDTNPANDTCIQKFFVRVTDIGVLELLQPHDTLDSGVVVTPTARVWSFGNKTLDFDVSFTIGEYESVRNLTLPGGGSTVVAAPDSYTAMPGIWLYTVTAIVPGDLHPENNTIGETIYVRGTISHEVGIQVLMPAIVFASEAFTPCARVTNKTGNTESFWAQFFIYDSARTQRFYAESLQVMVGGNDSAIVNFPSTAITDTGAYVAIGVIPTWPGISPSDTHYFRVVPPHPGDIGVVRIISPPAFVPVRMSIEPTAIWKNYSDNPMGFTGYFMLYNPYGAKVYMELLEVPMLGAGADETLTFAEFNVDTVEGRWSAFCSTYAVGDTNPENDTLRRRFTVMSPGVEESGPLTAYGLQPTATILSGATGVTRLASSVIFDAVGRRVASPRTGVYFVREPSAVSGRPSAVRKVILQR